MDYRGKNASARVADGTSRSVMFCSTRTRIFRHQVLGGVGDTSFWSAEEKQRFDDAYKKYRDDGLPDWSGRVAKAVGTRSKVQVRSRATNQAHKNRTVS